ncbi:MAG: hypothetical protein RIC55_20545, partial [Pirellulaceae bacterium]
MRSSHIVSLVLILQFVFCCAANAQRIDPASLELGKATPIKASRGLYAPGDLKLIKALEAGKPDAELRSRAVFRQNNLAYVALHIEFKDAKSCNRFNVKDATIITRFEQFADVFIPDDTSVLALVREVPGVRWVEVDRGGIVPPI